MLAHLVRTGFGGFYDGIAHWALSPGDVMVVAALALLAGLGDRSRAAAIVVALPASWLLGCLTGTFFPDVSEPVLPAALALVLAGGLAAVDLRLPRFVALLLAIACGAVHGLSNGVALASRADPYLQTAGVVTAAATGILLLAAGLLAIPDHPLRRIVMRVAGSWLAATGILMLAWHLR